MSELRIDFTPRFLPILDLFKAKFDIRYYLRGVYVEKADKGGVYLVATDGHTMAVVYDKDGQIEGAESAIVTVEPGLVSAAKKAESPAAKGLKYRVLVRGTRAMVAVPDANDLELFIQPGRCLIEAAYPKWRKVLPDFTKLRQGALSSWTVNSVYMARFAKIKGAKYPDISLWQEEGEGKPVIVQVLELPEALFVVMPMRRVGDPLAFAQFHQPAKVEETMPLAEAV